MKSLIAVLMTSAALVGAAQAEGKAVVAVFWSAWWFAGAHWSEAGLRLWLAERRADGWVADASAIRVAGFPIRSP